ncbi:hypothetical protein SAMN04488058_1022 [Deinococcus reticulitermitis]|uniref:Uncharacterized protein n=1 Tax=Deinococcus reticulitermitis TaxID=856736 RepID=A0A1H6TTE1_9DEIO|nr:hypothetical protein [Deinococcus reticulitermitis]SEI83291.1 hypothetical protein SAMN04488058_1022 [Deinococcus reticulitermitis]
MTVPQPQDTRPPSPAGPAPRRLSFLTLPLMIGLVYNSLSLLTIPFSGEVIGDMVAEYSRVSGVALPALSPSLIQTALWISFVLTAILILWLYFTRRAVLEGRSWGRVSSIVLAVLSLLLFPFGTVLGVFMLIGAFDRDVVAYTRR